MKPLHIVILLAAGAIGGAVIMKVAVRPQTVEPPPLVAHVQTPPATAPATPATQPSEPSAELATRSTQPADARATGVPANPSLLKAPKPVREAPPMRRARRAPVNQHPAAVLAPPIQPIAPAAAKPAAPEPAAPAPAEPAPQPVPPARVEPEYATPPPPAPPEPHRVTLNAGTLIPVRLVDGLTSERSLPGDSFTATLDKELVVDGFVIAERGARVEGRVVASDKGGRLKGVSSLTVELVRLRTSDGQTVAIQTDGFERRAEETRRQDAEKIGGGAALGAVIGAIAGGGKGAAIGAGVGGGAGAGTVMATRGNAATLPSETRVTFRLRAPVTITEKLLQSRDR
jgi:hypothetical protein